nr:putative transposase (putative), gypsy type [Tanacetum cinerariifolium]
MPTEKIGVYTKFFEFANFRLPLSTFLVNVLTHYRINLSQLSVIAAAKVSHFEILCRVHGIEPTVGLFRCFYVKVGEQEGAEEEARLLDSTIERVVSLLPIAPARAESELEASVERLFDEGGSADQGDFAGGGGQDAGTGLDKEVKIFVAGDVAAEKPKRPRKKRQVVTDASGSSHPPKKLRGDYGTSGEVATSGKSPSALRELLASSMRNVEAGVAAVATSAMVTSLVSATPEHESGAPIDSITGANLRTIGASERFVISSDSSHHSGTNASGPEDDSIIRSVVVPPVMTEAVVTSHAVTVPSVLKTGAKVTSPIHASLFQDSDSIETVKAYVAGPSYFGKQDLSMGSRELDVEILRQVLFRNGIERKRLESECEKPADLLKVRDEEKNVAFENEKGSLDGKVAELQSLVSTKDLELKDLNVRYLLSDPRRMVHALETTCSGLRDQDGLSTGIDHGKAGRTLADVVAYNSATKVDYNSALQRLHEVDFSLLAKLKSHKDANVEDIMNLLRLEGPLVDAPIMNDLQPDVDQLMLPVHRTEDQVVLGETSLSFALSVTHSRVERIRENVAAKRLALIGVWTPLVDLLSVENLVGESSTSEGVPTIITTTTALSTTFASASSVPPITIEITRS